MPFRKYCKDIEKILRKDRKRESIFAYSRYTVERELLPFRQRYLNEIGTIGRKEGSCEKEQGSRPFWPFYEIKVARWRSFKYRADGLNGSVTSWSHEWLLTHFTSKEARSSLYQLSIWLACDLSHPSALHLQRITNGTYVATDRVPPLPIDIKIQEIAKVNRHFYSTNSLI